MTDKQYPTLAESLALAQQNMGKALKDTSNPFFKSKYADLSSVIGACLGALNDQGISVTQPIEITDFGNVVKTVLHHKSGATLECSVPLILGKQDMQGLGSAITYARRYGLMCMAGIAPEDDDGNAAVKATPMGNALKDAWKQSVEDALPPNATPQEKAKAYADAICDDFKSKGQKALDNRWNKHQQMINAFANKYPQLHGQIIDAYETQKLSNEDQEAA